MEFIHNYKFKNEATSNMKNYHVLSSIGLDIVGIYLRDGPFSSDVEIVNLHPSKGKHWVAYINENFSDSYGCFYPKKLSRFIINQNGYCFYSEYKIQDLTSKRNSYCASYCLYLINLTKALGIGFESAVLNVYYQMIQER